MGILAGTTGEQLVAAGAAIAAFGALNGWILIMGQIARATAKDKLFPKVFSKENKKGVPFIGMVIGSALTSIVMLMNYTEGLVEQFRFMILLGTLCTLVPYLFSAAAYVILGKKSYSTSHLRILGGLGFVFSIWMIYGTGEEAVFWGTLLLLAGTPFYIWMSKRWLIQSKPFIQNTINYLRCSCADRKLLSNPLKESIANGRSSTILMLLT